MQSLHMPNEDAARAFEQSLKHEDRASIIHHEHLRDGRVRLDQVFIGQRSRDVQAAMDERLQEARQHGGTEILRARIGRNSPCPCESGRKFKKCCIDKAQPVG